MVEDGQLLEIVKELDRWLENAEDWYEFVLVAWFSAASWVALGMAHQVTTGGSPQGILVGAVVGNLLLLKAVRGWKARALVATHLVAMLLLLWRAGPLSQAGAIVFATWFLLIGGVKESSDLVRYLWNVDRAEHDLAKLFSLPPRAWSVLLLAFALIALIVSARWLLQWQPGPGYRPEWIFDDLLARTTG
jgi:hypothetical protein